MIGTGFGILDIIVAMLIIWHYILFKRHIVDEQNEDLKKVRAIRFAIVCVLSVILPLYLAGSIISLYAFIAVLIILLFFWELHKIFFEKVQM